MRGLLKVEIKLDCCGLVTPYGVEDPDQNWFR